MCNRRAALSVVGMQNTAIEVSDIHKSYDRQPVLRGGSFAARRSVVRALGCE